MPTIHATAIQARQPRSCTALLRVAACYIQIRLERLNEIDKSVVAVATVFDCLLVEAVDKSCLFEVCLDCVPIAATTSALAHNHDRCGGCLVTRLLGSGLSAYPASQVSI